MKKIILIVAMALALTACANNDAIDDVNQNVVENDNIAVNDSSATETPDPQDTEAVEENEFAFGKKIPDFEFVNLEGEMVKIRDYEGQIIMLNFWATWCPYCIEEMPDMEIMNQEEDVVVLAINSAESIGKVTKYIKENPYAFEILLDESGMYSQMFNVVSLPTTFFINEEGILLGNMPGMMTKEQMEQIIQDIRDDKL
jgi:peroxiredoxin